MSIIYIYETSVKKKVWTNFKNGQKKIDTHNTGKETPIISTYIKTCPTSLVIRKRPKYPFAHEMLATVLKPDRSMSLRG